MVRKKKRANLYLRAGVQTPSNLDTKREVSELLHRGFEGEKSSGLTKSDLI